MDYLAVLRRDPCSYCGGPAGAADHIVARSCGGEDGWENRTGTCASCNSRKGARPLLLALLGNLPFAPSPPPPSPETATGDVFDRILVDATPEEEEAFWVSFLQFFCPEIETVEDARIFCEAFTEAYAAT